MSKLKEKLYAYCLSHVETGIRAAQQAIEDARNASANETKSSAGDKYETAREMMQQEIEMNSARLAELQKLKAMLETLGPVQRTDVVATGSLVHTGDARYYIAAGIGKISMDGDIYYCISPAAPLAIKLMGLKKGDSLEMNSKLLVIRDIE